MTSNWLSSNCKNKKNIIKIRDDEEEEEDVIVDMAVAADVVTEGPSDDPSEHWENISVENLNDPDSICKI